MKRTALGSSSNRAKDAGRIVYYDAPGLDAVDAAERRAWIDTPLAATFNPIGEGLQMASEDGASPAGLVLDQCRHVGIGVQAEGEVQMFCGLATRGSTLRSA